jgi:hypothetical protein
VLTEENHHGFNMFTRLDPILDQCTEKGDESEHAGFLGLGCMLFCSIQISTDVRARYLFEAP